MDLAKRLYRDGQWEPAEYLETLQDLVDFGPTDLYVNTMPSEFLLDFLNYREDFLKGNR